ncbi:MAG: thioredoxin domain-containing protein [Proteobacteria bacterium]|nr:thioredoxin domain-containing protein [Pseudomonadota bacterium]
MTDTQPHTRSTLYLTLAAVGIAGLGALGGWMLERNRVDFADLSPGQKAAMGKVVHDYILEHPEVLPEAVDKLRQKDSARQLAGIADKVAMPYPGAVMGNPAGKVTLVEFSDFACTYCRQSEAALAELIAENPDLKVVVRHLPIIAQTSPAAAAMGLAAADQGKYPAFHKAMFAAGRTDPASIEAAARASGLDVARARQAAQRPEVRAELEANIAFARKLGFDGTPAWVIGDQVLQGAVGKEALAKAVAEARKS